MTDSDSGPNYTKIPNHILDAMPTLKEAELRVVLAIARKTFGWQKECDILSVSQIATITGLTRRNTHTALQSLVEKGLISREKAGAQAYCYRVEPYPLGIQSDHIPKGNVSPRDTEPYPLGIQSEAKPYPLGITQKKGSKEKKERERAARPPKQVNLDQLHEAVQAYKKLSGQRIVPPTVAQLIAETVIDIPKWEHVVDTWCKRGFKAGNVEGMIDWYLHPEKMQRYENRTNGSRPTERRIPDLPVVRAPPEPIRTASAERRAEIIDQARKDKPP